MYVALSLLSLFAFVLACPPQYLPSYRRGGWGRHYKVENWNR
jgi:hypothetical protein